MPIETWRRYAPLYIGWRGLLMLGVLTREERARSADQRQQHESEDEQRPKQQQEVIVGQHQRLALRQIGKQLDRGAVGISGSTNRTGSCAFRENAAPPPALD